VVLGSAQEVWVGIAHVTIERPTVEKGVQGAASLQGVIDASARLGRVSDVLRFP
jgi:hypothetical protein